MRYGYDDELFQAWRDGKIRRKDLPEELVAMTLDLCARGGEPRAEQERCRARGACARPRCAAYAWRGRVRGMDRELTTGCAPGPPARLQPVDKSCH